jgi:hypothetical protein
VPDKENASNTFGKSQIPVRVRPKQNKLQAEAGLKAMMAAENKAAREGGPSPIKMQGALLLFVDGSKQWKKKSQPTPFSNAEFLRSKPRSTSPVKDKREERPKTPAEGFDIFLSNCKISKFSCVKFVTSSYWNICIAAPKMPQHVFAPKPASVVAKVVPEDEEQDKRSSKVMRKPSKLMSAWMFLV